MPLQKIFLCGKTSIHERYSHLINNLKFQSPVLKTDLWNELKTDWPIQADSFVEIDEELVKIANMKGLNSINCSITELNIKCGSFKTIIDLSTIDHIEDPYPALKEYYRVLENSPDSNCFIVCWIGMQEPLKMNDWDGWQFCFNKDDFISKIYKVGFSINGLEVFKSIGNPEKQLIYFHLKKSSNYFQYIFKRFGIFELTTNINFDSDFINAKRLIKLNSFNNTTIDILNDCSTYNLQIINNSQNDSGFYFLSNNLDPFIILPQLPYFTHNIFIEVDITTPNATIVQVFYKFNESQKYSEENSVAEQTSKGRNKIQLFIPELEIKGQLRIDPGNLNGEYIIHKLKISTWHKL